MAESVLDSVDPKPGPQAEIDRVVQAATEATKKKVAFGRWAQPFDYDPERGSRAANFLTPVHDYARRFAVFSGVSESQIREKGEQLAVRVPGMPGPFIPVELEGRVLVPASPKRSELGRRWMGVDVKEAKEYTQLLASQAGKAKRFLEQFGSDVFGGSFDPPISGNPMDATRLIDTEFVPIMSGPFFKQMYLYDYLYMHARAFEMTNHSALAAAAVKIMTRFVLGRGVNFHVRHEAARMVWEEFWERNFMREKLRLAARDLPWQGELMWRFYERSKGFATVKLVDPSICWEVVTDPEDIDRVYYYHMQWPTPYQIWVSEKIPVSKYIIQQVPATNILHIKINVSSQEKRGRSDLLPAMPWIKRFNDFYNGQALKAVLEANLVFKVKIKGDQADVDAFLQNPALTELPPPGGVWIENEAVDLTSTSAQLTAGRGSAGIGQQLAAVIACSMNLPNEYFNVEAGAGGARATALVRTDPAVKTIEDRQQILREAVEQIYDHVMALALDAGRIPPEAIRNDPEASADNDEDTDFDLRDLVRTNGSAPQRRPVQAVLVRNVR